MHHDLERILIDRDEIALRVHELGEQIARDLLGELEREGSPPDASGRIVLVPIMVGSVIFLADLMRQLPMKLSLGLVAVTSYPGQSTTSKGAQLRSELPADLSGKHVLIIDDILDSGRTLAMIRSLILEQNPASCRICVLLDKQTERAEEVPVDYAGFSIPDAFVVGYGLDYDGHYRNLPDIGVLRVEEA